MREIGRAVFSGLAVAVATLAVYNILGLVQITFDYAADCIGPQNVGRVAALAVGFALGAVGYLARRKLP